ncbi:radical SAM protein [Parabacteroides sp.]
MEKVLSRYIYWFESSTNKYLVYNSRYNSLYEVSGNVFKELNKLKNDINYIDYISVDIMEILNRNNIFVSENEDDDFVLELQYRTERAAFSKSKLGLILVPSLGCNFSCRYCFEEHKRDKVMDDKTIDSIILFIKNNKEAKELELVWYGGEPLMAFSAIKKILFRIKNEVNIPIIKHNIITNGYYFNNDVIDYFKNNHLDVIQITLDGERERHNNIRKIKETNEHTYDKIIDNIDNILNSLPNTSVHVRVNIEKSNINDYYEAVEVLGKKWSGKNVIIYPGMLRIENETNMKLSCNCLQKKEISEFMFDINKRGILKQDIYPHSIFCKTCSATRINSFIIGPYGEIYKCWNDVSDNNKVIANVNDGKIINKSLYYRYLIGSKWYNNVSCRKCFFLPICNGSCAWYSLKNKYQNGKFSLCDCMQKYPGMLNKCLEYVYEVNKL